MTTYTQQVVDLMDDGNWAGWPFFPGSDDELGVKLEETTVYGNSIIIHTNY